MQIRPPLMVSYSITTKRNLKCKHCYSESVDQPAPNELATEEAFQLTDDLSKWGGKEQWSGWPKLRSAPS